MHPATRPSLAIFSQQIILGSSQQEQDAGLDVLASVRLPFGGL